MFGFVGARGVIFLMNGTLSHVHMQGREGLSPVHFLPHDRTQVRTQFGVTASAGQRRGNVESAITSGTPLAAGAWSSSSASPTTDTGVAALS